MMKYILLLCLVAFVTGQGQFPNQCLTGKYPPKDKQQIPTHVINLDLDPKERWGELMKGKGKDVANLLAVFKQVLATFSKETSVLVDLVDKDLGGLADSLPAPFGDEMKGIATATGLPLGEIVLFNIFYEVFTVCTSIVAEDPQGVLYHARNLDFGLFMGWNASSHTWEVTEALKPMTVVLDFQRGGKTLYKSVSFAGYIGAFTGIRPGIFTLTINERFNIDGGFLGIIQWILGNRGIHWMSFLTRETLETANSYSEAVDKLSTTPLLAPAYYIVGGNKSREGCVITRSRTKALDVWTMDKAGTFYVLETNYDRWEKPFFLDDRRGPAHKCMQQKTSKAVSIAGLYDVLSSKPMLNKLTTYTALMQVNKGTLEAYLQDCPDPCFPW